MHPAIGIQHDAVRDLYFFQDRILYRENYLPAFLNQLDIDNGFSPRLYDL